MKRTSGPRLRTRLLAANLVVVAVGSVTVLLAVGLVAPDAFETAMGHAGSGMEGMGEMMSGLVRAAFRDAVQSALVVAVVAAVVAAVVVSLPLSTRLSRPISRLAEASGRIAAGRYAERMETTTGDEIGALADSFNTMAASLEATERRRLELVGDVAHELRTPLTTIDGYLEGLQDGVIGPGEGTWTLLRRETSRLARIVDDLQELWRAEARQLPVTLEDVDVASLLADGAERFATLAGERSITVRIDAPAGLPAARADGARLGQALDNLLSNAIRYSPDASEIVVAARARESGVEIAVTDQGPGLTEEQRSQVFERFYRVDPSRSRALGGSGIGLAITRALVQLMDGRVWAESPGPGLGSTFRILLPGAD